MYKLCTTPTDVTSPIYKLSVPFFDKRTPEEWIKFQHRLQAVLKGQNVMQSSPSYAVAKTLLKGDVLTVFKQAEISHGNQTAGQTQKQYMQRNIRYDGGITVKEWMA
eukprot:8436688-Ditylum_brightwellii.AAC.2